MKNPFRLKPLHMLTYLLVAGLSFLTSCENGIPVPPAIEDNEFEKSDVAIEWYKLQLHIILNANPPISPSIVSRIFAYEGIGLYESARCRIRNSVSLSNSLYQMPAMPSKENNRGYSQSISANATLASLVRSLYPNLTDPNKTSIDSLENAFNEMSKPDMQSEVFKRSQSFGLAIAGAVFNWSKTDNDNQSNVGYVPPVFDGAWVPTPPALASAAAPYLGSARPLLQSDVAGVAPPPAFAYSEAVGSDFYNMVKDIYDVSQALTPEQKNIALFWNDVGVKKGYTPPGHSISILNQILEKQHASLSLAAEAYAKLGIALRDATILTWRSKFTYNQLRPVTYIRKLIDPNWLPLLGTPPHPEYPAAHAYITSAVMQTLTGIFGTHYAFTDNTYNFLGYAPRNYSTLNDAGVESGISRRFGGIHYMPSIQVGLALGKELGTRVNHIKLTKY